MDFWCKLKLTIYFSYAFLSGMDYIKSSDFFSIIIFYIVRISNPKSLCPKIYWYNLCIFIFIKLLNASFLLLWLNTNSNYNKCLTCYVGNDLLKLLIVDWCRMNLFKGDIKRREIWMRFDCLWIYEKPTIILCF